MACTTRDKLQAENRGLCAIIARFICLNKHVLHKHLRSPKLRLVSLHWSYLASLPVCMKPIAVVVGATGKQGTGIVETLLAGRAFQVRAISRDVSSAASKYLASLGAQLCEGSSSSVDQLTRHFAGAQAVFGQTPHNVPEDFEIAAALAQAKAASRAGVKSLVLSSLENVDKRSEVCCPGQEYLCAAYLLPNQPPNSNVLALCRENIMCHSSLPRPRQLLRSKQNILRCL